MLAENNGRAGNVEPRVTMLQHKEHEIRLIFLEEATEHLNTIESTVLVSTGSQLNNKQLDDLLRAAHSIKGGAAMMGFQALSRVACQFEDFFKPFKNQQQQAMSDELSGLLLAIVEQMRACIALNLEGKVVGDQWLSNVTPFLANLHQFIGDFIPQSHKDTTATLPLENNPHVVVMLFETEVKEYLDYLSDALANPEQYNLLDEFLIVLSALSGLGEMLQIPAFTKLCESITQHLERNPERVKESAPIALSHLRRSQTAVVSGQMDILTGQIDWSNLVEAPLNHSLINQLETVRLTNLDKTSSNSDLAILENEALTPCSNNQRNGDTQTPEIEPIDFSTSSDFKPELADAKHSQVSADTICISVEQFHQINEFIDRTKSSLSQLGNLLKVIEQQRSQTQLFEASVQLDGDEIPIEFYDKIESQDTGGVLHTLSKQHTILVIDDSETVRIFLKSLLLKAGYQVEMAEDGQIAIEKLQGTLDVSAVICDLDMPRVTGYDFLSRVKSDDAFSHLPVAMLTSHTEDNDRQRAMLLGASAYFTKPCDPQKLLETLRELICISPAT